jgi:hypothetical protein
VYVASGKMRGDFSTVVNGQTNVAHMLIADNTMYTWIDGTDTGYKMSVEATAGDSGSQSQMDLNQPVDYDCGSWSPDQSAFNVPAGINFMTAGSFGTGAPDAAQCSTCDQLSGDAKAQCKAALKCQ